MQALQPVQLFMSIDMPQALSLYSQLGKSELLLSVFVCLALVGKSGIGLVLIERRVANDAALADRLIGFERVVAVALLPKVFRDDPGSGSW
jgi:hypothetical protein